MSIDTVLITCAGGGGANNLIRSIRQSRYSDVEIIGTDSDEYLIQKTNADEGYVVPPGSSDRYVDVMNEIIEKHGVDVFIPQHETEVDKVSDNKDEFDCKTHLPAGETTDLCLDKLRLPEKLDDWGFPVPDTVSLENASIRGAFDRLSDGEPLWCRLRRGSSSVEAMPVRSVDQAEQWIRHWCEVKGISEEAFTLSEFLPGKDYQVFTLWNDGELVIGKTCDRRRYFFGQENTGASTPLLSRLIDDDDLHSMAKKIIENVNPEANGNLGVDFKVSKDGVPKVTEINVGKFVMVNDFFNLTGEHNMAECFLDICNPDTEPPQLDEPFGDIDTDKFLIRGIDLTPDIVSVDEIEFTPSYR